MRAARSLTPLLPSVVKRRFRKPLASLGEKAFFFGKTDDDRINHPKKVRKFHADMMEVARAWCRNSTFKQICQMTDMYEGTIVRNARREVELLRQLCSASKVVGDAELEAKFEKTIAAMQRDIMFAASLYL